MLHLTASTVLLASMHPMEGTHCYLIVYHAQVDDTALVQTHQRVRSASLGVGVQRALLIQSRALVGLSRLTLDSRTAMTVCRDSSAMMTIVALSMIVRKATGAAQDLNFLLLVQRERLGQPKTWRQKRTAVSVQQGSSANRQP